MEILDIMKVPYYRNGKSILIDNPSQRYIKKHDLGGIAEAGVSLLPGVGTGMLIYKMRQNAKSGEGNKWQDWATLALSAASDLTLAVPIVGPAASVGLKTAATGFRTANAINKGVKVINTANKALGAYNLGNEIINTGQEYAQSKNTSQPIKQTGLLTQVQNTKIPNTI